MNFGRSQEAITGEAIIHLYNRLGEVVGQGVPSLLLHEQLSYTLSTSSMSSANQLISLYDPRTNRFPIGLFENVRHLLKDQLWHLEIRDNRESNVATDELLDTVAAKLGLFDYQVVALNTLAAGPTGYVSLPSGSGKTLIGIAAAMLAVKQGHSVLIVVPQRRVLADQWIERVRTFTGLEAVPIYGGKQYKDGSVFIATIGSLHRFTDMLNRTPSRRKQLTCIIDEFHELAGPRVFTERLVDLLSPALHSPDDSPCSDVARVWGLSATPFRNKTDQDICIRALFVNEVYRYETGTYWVRNDMSPVLVAYKFVETQLERLKLGDTDVQSYRDAVIIYNQARNALVADIAWELISSGRHPLILVKHIRHANQLSKHLTEKGVSHSVLTGQTAASERTQAIQRFREGEYDTIVATEILTTGVDADTIDTVFFAGGQGNEPTALIQSAGRALRFTNKRPRIVMLYDTGLATLERASRRRLKHICKLLDVNDVLIRKDLQRHKIATRRWRRKPDNEHQTELGI